MWVFFFGGEKYLGFLFLVNEGRGRFLFILWLDSPFGSDSTWGALFIIQSIKTMVADVGPIPSQKIERLGKERLSSGSHLIQVIISFCLCPLPFVLHLCWGTLGLFLNLPCPNLAFLIIRVSFLIIKFGFVFGLCIYILPPCIYVCLITSLPFACELYYIYFVYIYIYTLCITDFSMRVGWYCYVSQ